MGHVVVLAEHGRQAIELCASEKPDMVLMDIRMPVMNGLEAIAAIRQQLVDNWIPIIAVSALNDSDDIVSGLQAGADDYLSKPIEQNILRAKICSVERTLTLQRRIVSDSEQLQRYREQNEHERDLLHAIFSRLIKLNDLKDNCLQYWLTPAQRFSGDLICAKRIDADQMCFMLADSTGHGLAAALPTVIVNQVFQGMTKKALPIAEIAREINHHLHSQLPVGHFVALTLGIVDKSQCRIDIWNGGLPSALVLDEDGRVLHSFDSIHPSSGILLDENFDDSCETWHWKGSCELFVYSDGITEARNAEQQILGSQCLRDILLHTKHGERVNAVRQALQHFIGDEDEQDDMSCLAICCSNL